MKIEDLKVGRVYRAKRPRKAYIFYRRRVRTLLATGRYLLTIDYRKKDINNEK